MVLEKEAVQKKTNPGKNPWMTNAVSYKKSIKEIRVWSL